MGDRQPVDVAIATVANAAIPKAIAFLSLNLCLGVVREVINPIQLLAFLRPAKPIVAIKFFGTKESIQSISSKVKDSVL